MTREEWLHGVKQIIPVAVSYIPLGLACGIAMYAAGFSRAGIFLISLLVYAGAGQFMAASMVTMGAPIPSIIIMTFFLNLRHMLMSSSISGYLKNKSVPFMTLFGHTLTDESYGVNIHRFTNDKSWTPNQALAANILAYSVWVGSSVAGGLLGKTLSVDTIVVNYVLIAMFISMLLDQFATKKHMIVAVISALLSVVLKIAMQHNISLVIAAVIASYVGYRLDAGDQKSTVEEEAIQYDER